MNSAAMAEKIIKLEDRVATLESQNQQLLEELKLALLRQYGKSSEKFSGQDLLPFEELQESQPPTPDPLQTVTYERSKPGRKPLAENLPREHHFHDLTDAEKLCACGQVMKSIGEDVSERLNVIPPKLWVDCHHNLKYACAHCQGLSDESKPAVRTAPGVPALIPGGIVTPGLLAFIWTNKFCDHQPFYRQENGFQRIGALVSRQDMSNWTLKLTDSLEPLINLLETHIRGGPVIQMDETPVKVLKLDHTGKDGQGYMWLALGGHPEKRAVRYRFAPGRGSLIASKFLGDYSGFLQTDGYKAYDTATVRGEWIHVGCWAHARRKFYEADKAAPSGTTKDALGRIKKLYEIERHCRDLKLPEEEFLKIRKEKLDPFLKDLRDWMELTSAKTLPTGATGEAFAYTLRQWEKLVRFVDHQGLTPDNNRAENAIRPFVLGRKNWLFSGNDAGAEASCRVFSLIETAKLNGLEPYAYLLKVLANLPSVRISGTWESLLPWNLRG